MVVRTKNITKLKYNVTPNRKGSVIYIPFDADANQLIQVDGISGLTFVPDNTNAEPLASTLIRVKADGTNTPTVTGFTKTSTSSDYDTTLNKINVFSFFFDGTDYWYSITIS